MISIKNCQECGAGACLNADLIEELHNEVNYQRYRADNWRRMMTFDERFSLLQAHKPLPLISQPAARNPGPIGLAIDTMISADHMIALYRRKFTVAQLQLLRASPAAVDTGGE